MKIEILKNNIELLMQIVELEKEIFLESNYSQKTLEEMLVNNEYLFLVATENNIVLGYLLLHDSYDVYEIMKIAVRKEYRGKNIGKKLIEVFKNIKKIDIFLEVRESNFIARKFYEKLKFKVVGERKKYYPNGETAILMILNNN